MGGGRRFYPELPSRHYSPKGEPDSRGEATACHIGSWFSPSLPLWPTVRGPSALVPGSLGRGSLVQGQTWSLVRTIWKRQCVQLWRPCTIQILHGPYWRPFTTWSLQRTTSYDRLTLGSCREERMDWRFISRTVTLFCIGTLTVVRVWIERSNYASFLHSLST